MSWTDEMIAVLKEGVKEQKSASEIEADLKFEKSRSAVIGKIHRLGLGSEWTAEHRKARHRMRVKRRSIRNAKRLPVRPQVEGPALCKVEQPDIKPDGFVPAPEVLPAALVMLAEWPDGACKWPYGSDPVMFGCKGKKVPGLPYCEEHQGIAFQPPKPSRPVHEIEKVPAKKIIEEVLA